jgi:hypothetical protein
MMRTGRRRWPVMHHAMAVYYPAVMHYMMRPRMMYRGMMHDVMRRPAMHRMAGVLLTWLGKSKTADNQDQQA